MRTLAFIVLFSGRRCDMSRPSNGEASRRDAVAGPNELGGCIEGSNDSPFGVGSSSGCVTLCCASLAKLQPPHPGGARTTRCHYISSVESAEFFSGIRGRLLTSLWQLCCG